jgi:hypothetical protein
MLNNYKDLFGRATVNNGAATATVIAAPGAGKAIRVIAGVVNVTAAATGGGGTIEIRDGSTAILTFDANAVNSYPFAFDYSNGYPLTANTALNIATTGAVTTQATANIAVVAYQVG